MRRALVLLPLLLAALLLWERALARGAAGERDLRGRVGRIVPEERRAALALSALRVERPGVPTRTYGRLRGRWRALELFGAPADARAIGALADGLLDAQGFVVSDAPDEAAAYGIVGPDALRVSLCGPRVLEDPGGDVQIAFDVGASLPGEGQQGSFVRVRGAREIWSIDADPRAALAPRAGGLPALLEPWVVPMDWEGWRGGVTRVSVRDAAGARLALERRAREVTPEELRAGRPPWDWVLAPGALELPAAPVPAQAFSLFVQRLPYADVLDPARADALGARAGTGGALTLEAEGASPWTLLFGAPLPDGRVPVWSTPSETLYAMEPAPAALALPGVEPFLEASQANPWDPWLR